MANSSAKNKTMPTTPRTKAPPAWNAGLQTGTRSAPRCARHNPTRNGWLPLPPNAQERRRRPLPQEPSGFPNRTCRQGRWRYAVRGAERRCAGLETGVPSRMCREGRWGDDVRGAERRCAGLETGVPSRMCREGRWGDDVRGAERRGAGLETGVPSRMRREGGCGDDVRGAERRGAGLETGVPSQRHRVPVGDGNVAAGQRSPSRARRSKEHDDESSRWFAGIDLGDRGITFT